MFVTGPVRAYTGEEHPKDADLFILANGGSVFVPEKVKGFVDKYHPRRILVDHFDNAFPPVTRTVSVKRLKRSVEKRHPDIEFIVPEACKPMEL